MPQRRNQDDTVDQGENADGDAPPRVDADGADAVRYMVDNSRVKDTQL